MGLIHLTTGLVKDETGIWRGPIGSNIAYPQEGNAEHYEIEENSFWFKHRNDCIINIINKYPPSGTILDIGGGNGYVTRRLIDEGYDATLLEPGQIGVFNGRIHRRIPEIICASLKETNFVPESLSAVGCFDVIEHIYDDRGFIREIYRVLKPGGLLYSTVPAYLWLWSQSDADAQHYRRYDKPDIHKLLDKYFNINRFTHIFSFLTPFIYLLRTIPFRYTITNRKNLLSAEVEHGNTNNIGQIILKKILLRELHKIKKGQNQKYGSSCLFVAQRKHG